MCFKVIILLSLVHLEDFEKKKMFPAQIERRKQGLGNLQHGWRGGIGLDFWVGMRSYF